MNYVDQIAAAIQAQYPSLTEVIGIGRQNEEGVIVIGSESYGGITDKRDNYAYIRYRGREDWRHSRATRQISSTPTMEATAELRLVVVHREENTAAFVEGLAGVLMGVFKNIGGVHIQVVSTDQDRNRILREESKTDNGQWNMAVGLARVDFTLTYTYTGQPCNPADLCGGGTIPTPTDCPTLCDQITVATAQQVVDCFDSVKEAAVAALICDPCPPVPTLCEQIEEATVIEIIECLSPEQEDGIKAALCDPCPPCDPATYTNGAAFTVDIAAGGTYTAPNIQITDVDGSTRDSVANVGVVCEWKEVRVRSTDGSYTGATLTSYPAGGNSDTLQYRFRNSDGSLFAILAARGQIQIINANIESAVDDAPNLGTTNLTIDVDVPVVNSDGVAIGSNVDDLLNPHTLPDIDITDDDGAVATIAAPTAIVIDGVVDTASQDPATGIVTITPQAGVTPSGILYPDIAPATSYIDATAAGKDTVALWQAGAYTATKPANPAVIACLDPADATRSTMLNNNFFGNNYRWTDTAGNPSSVGTSAPSRYDWRNHNWAGAVQYIVIDHWLKAMYWVQFLTDAGKVAMRVDTGQSWYAWLNYIDGATLGGYSDWLPIPLDTRLPHAAFSDIGQTGFRNFLICNRADGRGGVMTGESVDGTYFYPFRDNFSFNLITSGPGGSAGAKAGLNSFSEGITDAYCMRILTDADIAALTA